MILSCYSGQVTRSLSRDQIRKMILRFQNEEFGNWHLVISSPPLCLASDVDERLFLQFNTTINIDEEMIRMVGFAHPDLIFLTQCLDTANIFIDCTFILCLRDSLNVWLLWFIILLRDYIPGFLSFCKVRNTRVFFLCNWSCYWPM